MVGVIRVGASAITAGCGGIKLSVAGEVIGCKWIGAAEEVWDTSIERISGLVIVGKGRVSATRVYAHGRVIDIGIRKESSVVRVGAPLDACDAGRWCVCGWVEVECKRIKAPQILAASWHMNVCRRIERGTGRISATLNEVKARGDAAGNGRQRVKPRVIRLHATDNEAIPRVDHRKRPVVERLGERATIGRRRGGKGRG